MTWRGRPLVDGTWTELAATALDGLGTVGLAVLVVFAFLTGRIVSGSEARRVQEAQQQVLDRVLAQNEALLKAVRTTVAVVEALPKVADQAVQVAQSPPSSGPEGE